MSHSGFQSLSSSDLQQEQGTAQAHAATADAAAAGGTAGSGHAFDGDELENGSSASTPLSSPDASSLAASATASASTSAAVASLRLALNAAQTRARTSEDANEWIYEHVHSSVAAAIKEVTKAKKRVKQIRIETKTSGGVAQPQQQQQGSMSARSASDSSPLHHALPHSQSSSGGLTVSSRSAAGAIAAGESFMFSSASSPHREAYLAALASPAGVGSLASSPRTAPSHMPSLALGSAALTASQIAAGLAAGRGSSARAEELSGSTIIEGSYCLLPFEADPLAAGSSIATASPTAASVSVSATATPAPPPALHHSSSHQAMLEAHQAMEELRRDTTGSASASGATSTASSLQVSPLAPADGDHPAAASYPSLPALHPASSPSHAFSSTSAPGSFANVNSILATSPYHIAPSTALPPLQRGRSLGAIGAGVGGKSGNLGSPRMQPQSPATMHAAQTSVSSGASGSTSTAPVASSSTTTPAPSLALSHALQSLHQAQSRFSTLAQFCAPLILRSPSVARLKEEVALQQLGVVPKPPKDLAASASSDEELSRSAEMQLEDLAAVAALASSVESSSAIRGGDEEHIESQSEEEKKQPASASASGNFSSLVIVPSAAGGATGAAASSSQIPPRPKFQSSHAIWEIHPKTESELAEEKEAMRMYIAELRAEVASADDAATNKEDGSALAEDSQPQAPLTLDQALEGCVLLHQLLVTAQSKLDAIDSAQTSVEVVDASARLADLQAANASLRASLQAAQSDLAELRRSHDAQAVKIANMERILALLEVPLTDKGTVREDFRFVKRSSGLWTSAALTLVFGGLVIVSALHWKRIIKAIRATVPRILNQLGLGGGDAAATAAKTAAEGANGAAQAAGHAATAATAAAFSPAAAAVAATVEASSQTAPPSASLHASTNTNTTSPYGPRLFSHVFHNSSSGSGSGSGRSSALNITRFPSIQDFLSNLSLQLVQIA